MLIIYDHERNRGGILIIFSQNKQKQTEKTKTCSQWSISWVVWFYEQGSMLWIKETNATKNSILVSRGSYYAISLWVICHRSDSITIDSITIHMIITTPSTKVKIYCFQSPIIDVYRTVCGINYHLCWAKLHLIMIRIIADHLDNLT